MSSILKLTKTDGTNILLSKDNVEQKYPLIKKYTRADKSCTFILEKSSGTNINLIVGNGNTSCFMAMVLTNAGKIINVGQICGTSTVTFTNNTVTITGNPYSVFEMFSFDDDVWSAS